MKRWLSVLLTLCLCVGLALPAAAADTEDVTVPTDYWTDEGNYKMPSIDAETRTVSITSAAELAWVAWKCMQGTTFGEYTILLENDIDLSGHLWMPIGGRDKNGNGGSSTNPFSGVFDGQGHRIYGMVCSDTDNTYKNYTALFGILSDGTIRNLSVDGNVTAYANAALLVGSLGTGTSGTGTSSVVLNCNVSGTINTLVNNSVGALIGHAFHGMVYNCTANCIIRTGNSQYRGAFLGSYIWTLVVNCCWNAETIEQPIGDNFENCYAIPANNTVDYAEKLNEVMIEGAAKWVMGDDGYPTLDFNDRVQNWVDMAKPVTPVNDVYYIDKPEQLAYIAKIVNEGSTLEGQTVLLHSDLDLSGKIWTPIGRYQIPFSGELNGNGHSVTGLTISYNSLGYLEGYAGLVGFAGKTAYLHHLNIDGTILSDRFHCGLLLGGSQSGSRIKRCIVTGSVTAVASIGGVAGTAYQISQCEAKNVVLTTNPNNGGAGGICYDLNYYDESDTYVSECVSSGTIISYCNMGGIVGAASGSKKIKNCFSSMVLTGNSMIGGIADYIGDDAVVENCYYTGSITSSESKTSALIAGQGLYNGTAPTITNCYWSKECNMTIDGLPDVKRGVGTDVSEDPTTGLTLTEMRTKASYAGWDFDTVWAIDTNKNGGLPYLRWQDDVPTVIEPTSLTLSAETVTLAAGRSTTLTAVFSPIGAGGKPTWSSDAPDVASVTAGGQVTAHRAGTAIITASYGSLQASCSVTVTERSSDEYTIREITLKDASGKAVTGIPSDSFWAYVSVTKGANAKDATVLLASYDRNGQYLGLTALEADVPCGTTYRLGAWFANADRRIAKVKAFVVDGVGTMRPLAAAAEIS